MIDSNLVEKYCRENGQFRTEYDQILSLVTPTFKFSSPHHPIVGQVTVLENVVKVVFYNEDFQKTLEAKIPPSLFISLQKNPSTCWEISDLEDCAVFWKTVNETILAVPPDTFKPVDKITSGQSELDDRIYGPVFENEGKNWRADDFNPDHDADESTQSQLMRKVSHGWQIYRQRQDTLWNGMCAVTGITNPALLRASPAKRWDECDSGAERLDPYNGFLLSVGLDALFDADLISFTPDGDIMVSPSLTDEDLASAGITDTMYLKKVFPKNLPYLNVQRERFFIKCGKAGEKMREEMNSVKNRYIATLALDGQKISIPTSSRFVRNSEHMEILLTEYLTGLWLQLPPDIRKQVNNNECVQLSQFSKGLVWFDDEACQTDSKEIAFDLMSNVIGKVYNIVEPLLNSVTYPFHAERIDETALLATTWGEMVIALLPQEETGLDSRIENGTVARGTFNRRYYKTQIADRIKGCLFGEAIGDALGLGTEFMTSIQVKEHYPDGLLDYNQFVRDRHRSIWTPGEWTDDTDMALCIVDAMLEDEAINPMTVARNFRNWLDGNPKGCGRHTAMVVGLGDYLDNPMEVSKVIWEASANESAPNGALMRNAPIGLWNSDISKNAENICRITHYDPRCVGSCVVHSTLINNLVWRDEILSSDNLTEMADQYDGRIQEYILLGKQGLDALDLDEEKTIGYTLKGLGTAIWGYFHAENFEHGLLKIVNKGGDADTNGAIACSLLGAKFGYSGIPLKYINGLAHLNLLNDKVNRLTDLLLKKFY